MPGFKHKPHKGVQKGTNAKLQSKAEIQIVTLIQLNRFHKCERFTRFPEILCQKYKPVDEFFDGEISDRFQDTFCK